MANSITYDKLKRLGEEMSGISDVEEFGQKLKHRFMDFIHGHSDLEKEFIRRSEFYENLVDSPEFCGLLNSIHASFKELQKRIDPKKLPQDPRYINYDHKSEDAPDSLSLLEIHRMLGSRRGWPKFEPLNATTGVYVSQTGIRAPWDSDFRQYELVHDLVIQAEQAGAWKEPKKVMSIADEIVEGIRKLRECATAPLLRWHLAAFYDLKFYGRVPELLSSVEHISKSVSLVTSELLDHLRLLEEEKNESKGRKKKHIRSVKNGIVTTVKGDEYSFKKKNSNSALLCGKVYAYCRKVGDTVEISRVFSEVWTSAFNANSVGNKKTVMDAVENINKWATVNGLPKLLRCSKSRIERLA